MRKVNAPESGKRAITPYTLHHINNSHLPIPKFDLSNVDLLPVPTDGEWCCNWVNDVPVGVESFIECHDGSKRPSVIVEDWRLPASWTRHLYPMAGESGRWAVMLVSLVV